MAATANPQISARDVSDIVVTARRRSERLQDVPVSVSAFSAQALDRSTVQTISDINTITPGLVFASEGGKDNVSLSLRGIGQLPLGEATPGVVIYENNVPLPSLGSNIPTYDVASVQVLKGPQGTLFGRNTLGGAVLVGSQAPTYDFGGYIEANYGRFNYRTAEGALNLPIVKDKIALRLAGQVRRQDGRIENLEGGPDFDNIHQNSYRASLLLQPVDWIKSTTVYEYFKADERASGVHLIRRNFSYSALFTPTLGPVAGPLFGASLDAQTDVDVAAQKGNFYGAFDDGVNGGRSYRRAKSITNDTALSLGKFTLRNIFGYHENYSDQFINTGATGPLFLPTALLGAPANTPFVIQHAAATINRSYLTNETQFLGQFHGFNFILGGFYNNDKPHGPSGSTFTLFATPADPTPSITSHVENTNYAVFGQVGIDLTSKLKLDLGGRYSWDKAAACGGLFTGGYVTYSVCKQRAALNLIDGIGVIKNKGDAPSWTVGLDYKPNANLLIYVVSRRGYRGANVNTPLFESPFTTGAATGCTFGPCPDLRNFQKTGEERLTDVELGTKYNFAVDGMRGHVNLASYYSKYKNALQFLFVTSLGIPAGAPDSPTNGSVAANVANLTIWGLELEASISPTPNLTFSLNGAYTNSKVDSVNVPAGLTLTKAQVNLPSPTWAGTLSASWTLPFHPIDGNVVLNGDLYLTEKFGGQGGEQLPGYSLANIRLDWNDIGHTGIDVGGYIRNLFGKKYYQSTSVLLQVFPTSSAYVGEQRSWGVRARYRF